MPHDALRQPLEFQALSASSDSYIPRGLVENTLLDLLAADPSVCCVVKGTPGTGKSSLAAAMVGTHGYLHHFLRPAHTRSTLWRDPHAFLTSLGFQLRGRFGEALFPESIVINVNATARTVRSGGTAIGAEIGRLIAVPWRATTVHVTANATEVEGKLIGARIAEVADDYRYIPLTAFANMALVDPLRRLAELQPDARAVLWIDALDEEDDALAAGKDGISSVLPLPDELRAIGNLSIVITARDSRALDRFVAGGAHVIALNDERFADETTAVVRQYVDRELTVPDVASALARAAIDPASVRNAVIANCAGNLLYLRQFFLAVRDGHAKALMTGDVPNGLDAIYVRLLGEVVTRAGAAFAEVHRPILSCLAVATQPLSIAQLAAIAASDEDRVRVALLSELLPYLTELASGYSLYHKSIADTLIDDAHAREPWYVSAPRAHSHIARHYKNLAAGNWESLDDYGLDAVVYHLSRGEIAERQSVFGVIGEPLRRAQRHRHASNIQFASDLATAASAISTATTATPLGDMARLTLMATHVAEAEELVPDEAVTLLIRLGAPQRALATIRPNLSLGQANELRGAAIAGLIAAGDANLPIAREVLLDGLEHLARENDDQTHWLLGQLCERCPPDARFMTPDVVRRLVEVFNGANVFWGTPRALTGLARLIAAVDPEQARDIFRQCFEAIPQLTSSSRSYEHARLFGALAPFDVDQALELLRKASIRADESSVKAVLAVARALVPTNQDGAISLYQQIRTIADSCDSLYDKALAFAEIAAFEADHELPPAGESASIARGAALAMCPPDHPRASIASCRQQRSSALARVASVNGAINPAGDPELLESAWESLLSHGKFALETIDEIVREQLRQDPDLLDAIISTAQPLRVDLLLAYAAAVIDHDQQAARTAVENALLASERTVSQGAPRTLTLTTAAGPRTIAMSEEMALAVGKALGPNDIHIAAAIVEATLGPEAYLEWRAEILHRMIASANAGTLDWWNLTLSAWVERMDNPNFVADLPALIRDLPDALVSAAEVRLSDVADTTKRAWLAVAVGARVSRTDGNRGRSLLDRALADISNDIAPRNPADAILLAAFAAGQWQGVDASLASQCWAEANRLIDELTLGDADRRAYFVERSLELRGRGAPSDALVELQAAPVEEPDPNSFSFVAPGAGTPVARMAGVSSRDHSLAQMIADAAAQPGALGARDQLLAVENPHARTLALIDVARRAPDFSLKQRLDWCARAEQAAVEIGEHHLRCFFLAETALAFRDVGASKRALRLAGETARDIVENGASFASVNRKPAYGHAMGTCIGLLYEDAAHREEALALVWDARHLGHAFADVMVALVPGAARVAEGELWRLVEAERDAAALFSERL